jgi:signal transduction histidine kinase/DNA-binding response OmpR family regulator
MIRLAFPYFLFVFSLAAAQSKVDGTHVERSAKVRSAEKEVSYNNDGRNERGFFDIQNFTHQETGGHHQNWSITQDSNGFIYTGNGNGILEYDGETWRLISSPGLHAVRAVVADNKNVKWIGADRELGYLEPDSLGFLQFKSLRHKIPASHPLTGNVWQIFEDGDRILFVTENAIYSWRNNRFSVIPRQGEIQRGNQVNENLYFRISGKGMYRLSGEHLQLIPDGEKFQNLRVDVVLPYGSNSALFASREAGLFIFDGKSVTRFENEVDDYIIKNNPYTGLLLSDSSYAFATLRAGIIMMDRNGKRTREITTTEGILNNQVYGMVEDRHNTVWLALQMGVTQIQPFLPYTFYDKRSGLEGTVSVITRHNGHLYAGTYDGLFRQEYNSKLGQFKFQRIDGIQNGSFSLLSLGEDLLVGSASSLYLLTKGKVIEIEKFAACRALWRSKKFPNVIFVGHRGGLSTIQFENGQWQFEKDLKQVDGEIRSIVENDRGDLWLGTTLHKIIKVELLEPTNATGQINLDVVKVTYYDDRHGLPKETNAVYLIDNEILVYSPSESGSLFQFDNRNNKFFETTDFGKKFGVDTLSIFPIDDQSVGDYILLGSNSVAGKSYRFSAAKDHRSGSYKVTMIYNDRFRSSSEKPVYWDRDLLWFGGEYITRYDVNTSIDTKPHFSTRIRKVILGQTETIYGGETSAFLKSVLEYSSNGLRFEFAAPGFMGKETNKYQYQLIGFDQKWSDWTGDARKDYTNLPEGDYRFTVRAQNVYGQLSKPDVFNFEILAPWYRTLWAYALYALLFVGFLFFAIQLRARKLESEKRALALLVAARTEEIRSQANQLKVQAEKLQDLDQAKSRFFANISHEFRTPLTLISGCLEDFAKEVDGNDNRWRISIMQKNTLRLRQLIEQLLDLSKLESGKLTLKVASIDPGSFLRAIASSFSSWATQKEITLTTEMPDQPVQAYVDEDVLEKIVNNLLSNAIKFTPKRGTVSLTARWDENELTISVKDNGPGIPLSEINHVFERFYQVDGSNTRSQEGSGIGLALVKELVSLHHGQISVESELGVGTLFKVTIPIRQKIYSASEIKSVKKDKTTSRIVEVKSGETFPEFRDGPPGSPMILVVEDNVDLGAYISHHLPEYGIMRAINGRDGLDKAINHVPDLIISDVMMPEMDGVELCTKIKQDEKTSHIPLILLTAKADLESRLEGLETGADDYMTKPFDARELQTRVKNLIVQRAKLRERFSRTVVLKPQEIAITPPDETFLKKVMAIVEAHLSDSKFSVDDFEREIGMSRRQLHRKQTALTGHSAAEFMRIQRLIRASELLSKTDQNVSEVCYQTGFNNLSYFAKCFKTQFGATPKDFASMHSQPH